VKINLTTELNRYEWMEWNGIDLKWKVIISVLKDISFWIVWPWRSVNLY